MDKRMVLEAFKNQNFKKALESIPQKYNVDHDETHKTTTITIYGMIGETWFDDSVTVDDIDRALKEAEDNKVVINLNSPGGNPFDTIAIYNRLKKHNGHITVNIDGQVCSASTVIALAGDKVTMGLGSMMMIDEVKVLALGNKRTFREQANTIEKLDNGIMNIYSSKSTMSANNIKLLMEQETWMTATVAVEHGFADSIAGTAGEDWKQIARKDNNNHKRWRSLND